MEFFKVIKPVQNKNNYAYTNDESVISIPYLLGDHIRSLVLVGDMYLECVLNTACYRNFNVNLYMVWITNKGKSILLSILISISFSYCVLSRYPGVLYIFFWVHQVSSKLKFRRCTRFYIIYPYWPIILKYFFFFCYQVLVWILIGFCDYLDKHFRGKPTKKEKKKRKMQLRNSHKMQYVSHFIESTRTTKSITCGGDMK